MQREIEFRGKSTETGEFIFGALVIDTENKAQIISYANHEGNSYNWDEVDLETVGQYTGLKDCNGEKIFEGDIINYEAYSPKNKAKVIFDNGSYFAENISKYGGKHLLSEKVCDMGQTGSCDYNHEVIGNIYENLELLEIINN